MRDDYRKPTEDGVEISRDILLNLLQQANQVGSFRFARQTAYLWLEKYSNDLSIQLQLANACNSENNRDETLKLLESICSRDPEFLDAWELYLKVVPRNNPELISTINGYIHALGGIEQATTNLPKWSIALRDLISNSEKSSKVLFEPSIRELLASYQQIEIIGIQHLELTHLQQDNPATLQLGDIYRQRWPNCLRIALRYAESAIESGVEKEGVNVLHQCAALDPAGQVPERLWGSEHEFKSIWPQDMKILLTIPIPSQVAVPMGWNQLVAGMYTQKFQPNFKTNSYKFNPFKKKEKNIIDKKIAGIEKQNVAKSETKIADEVETEFNSIANKINKPELKDIEGRFPVYVVLSTQIGLIKKYGEKSTEVITQQIKKLLDVVSLRPGWRATTFYPDDINSARLFELDPISEIDPWKIKLALVDLDKYLGKKGEMIGCVLIVGDHDVIPFHALPNPTDDKDSAVLSDNPYSTLDNNYFVPEWPIGRLPGEAGGDPGLLLKQIRQVIQKHLSLYRRLPWWQLVINTINIWSNLNDFLKNVISKPQNYGYSASVWRRSSLAAFRPIGTGNLLRTSPPFNSDTLDINQILKAKFAYFNLHGLPETAEWYGQRDLSEDQSGPDFPIALSAKQIANTDTYPSVVYSEACYGANIQKRHVADSIALRFKDLGTYGFIGSSCISYGSVRTPLIGADLLGFLLWKYIKEGYSIGEAFLQAKIGFVKVMMQRQGYLDGEDQKTLISFILYGDPLMLAEEKIVITKNFHRKKQIIKINSITDQNGLENKERRVSGEVLNNLKEILKEYLPGLENAQVNIRHHQVVLFNSEKITHGNQSEVSHIANRVKITYCKSVQINKSTHYQYARVTLDNNGKMLKLSVSR